MHKIEIKKLAKIYKNFYHEIYKKIIRVFDLQNEGKKLDKIYKNKYKDYTKNYTKNTKVFKQKIQNFTTKITVKLQTELVKFQNSNSNFKHEFEFWNDNDHQVALKTCPAQFKIIRKS